MMFSGRGHRQQAESDGKVYSRSHVSSKPRVAETRNISRNPVISILRRIDEEKQREAAGRGVKQKAEESLAELEACLAALQRGAS